MRSRGFSSNIGWRSTAWAPSKLFIQEASLLRLNRDFESSLSSRGQSLHTSHARMTAGPRWLPHQKENWSEKLTRNRPGHPPSETGCHAQPMAPSKACTRAHRWGNSHLPSFHPQQRPLTLTPAPQRVSPRLSPTTPGTAWSAGFYLSFSQSEPQWELPLEDRRAPATLGPGQRFKINTLLTDRFFIYTFPREL